MRLILLPCLLLLACGPEKAGESTSTGAATSTDPSTSTTTTTTTPTTTAPTSGPGSEAVTTGTTDGPVSCDMFVSDGLGTPVAITLVHEGATPVWVPSVGCGSLLPGLKILDADQSDYFWLGGSCFPLACDEFMQLDSCSPMCDDDCSEPSAIRIAPGGRLPIIWPGGRGEELEMTAECAPGRDCQRSCWRAQQAPDGLYEVELPGFRSCTGACACEGEDEDGVCPIVDANELGEPTTFKVSFQYPQTDAVDLQITD